MIGRRANKRVMQILWICLAVVGVTLRAAAPGELLEGARVMQQDASGTIWCPQEHAVAYLEGKVWKQQPVPGLPDTCEYQSLARVPQGDVLFLWRDMSADTWVVTWHRGKESKVWTTFRAPFLTGNNMSSDEAPMMLGLGNGSVLFTEHGPSVVLVPADGGQPCVMEIPEKDFVLPAPDKDDHRHLPVRAVEDHAQGIWLWTPLLEKRIYPRYLRGLVHLDLGTQKFLPVPVEKDVLISDVKAWDDKELAVCLAGRGLFHLPVDALLSGAGLKPEPEPEPGAFKYVETLFHDGKAWYAVGTVQPTTHETRPASFIASGIIFFKEVHYDQTKPVDTLWRLEGTRWVEVVRGLDKEPAFGYGTKRPWLMTPMGLVVGSDEGAPWLVPSGEGKQPRRLAPELAFPLRYCAAFALASNDRLISVGHTYESVCASWSMRAPSTEAFAARLEPVCSTDTPVQGPQGHLWCLYENGTMMKWDGSKWGESVLPARDFGKAALHLLPDNRQQAWLFSGENIPTAVCHLATGEWQVFDSVPQALEAQLPHGVSFSFPGMHLHNPHFSNDGRIGIFLGGIGGEPEVMLYENKRWRRWKFADIAGQMRANSNLGPYFDEKGKFTVSSAGSTSWQWDGEKERWMSVEDLSEPEEIAEPEVEGQIGGRSVGQEGRLQGATDRFGVKWSLNAERQLQKSLDGHVALVFGVDDPNPFLQRPDPQSVLVDDSGHALVDTTYLGGDPHESLMIRARLPAPQTEATLTAVKGDGVQLRVANKSGGKSFFKWSVDGGLWSPLREGAELEISPLTAGPHEIKVRAFNADLSADPRGTTIHCEIKADAHEVADERILQLTTGTLEQREAAVQSLTLAGRALLPKLKVARAAAESSSARWWLEAVIQKIEESSGEPSLENR